MKKIRIPIEKLTSEKLAEIRNYSTISDIDQSYSILLGIEGAIEIDRENPLWKREQKSDNCGIECYFAFLEENLPPEVNSRMRKDLFTSSLNAALARSNTLLNGRKILELSRVQHKIHKLGIKPHSA